MLFCIVSGTGAEQPKASGRWTDLCATRNVSSRVCPRSNEKHSKLLDANRSIGTIIIPNRNSIKQRNQP